MICVCGVCVCVFVCESVYCVSVSVGWCVCVVCVSVCMVCGVCVSGVCMCVSVHVHLQTPGRYRDSASVVLPLIQDL